MTGNTGDGGKTLSVVNQRAGAAIAELTVGTSLGPYKILGKIGAGGMGVVYRARDGRLERDVAVKVLSGAVPYTDAALTRFEAEARAAGGLNHPNVVVVHDVGSHGELPYIVTELLHGETLRERIRAGHVPIARALEWGRQIAAGLAAAHERGIVHRDLKPENVFVTSDGAIKLLDFGLAKLVDKDTATGTTQPATQPGTLIGTVAYMAPEQAQGLEVDARSDLFSLGLILHEVLTGRRPFSGQSSAEIMAAILRDEPADLELSRPEVAPGVARIVRHCLEKRPNDRFQSARDLIFAIESLSPASPPRAEPAAAPAAPATPPPQAGRRALLALGVIALAGAAAATGAFFRKTPLPPAPALALPTAVPAPPPEWRRLTFGRGQIVVARFAEGDSFLFDRFTDLRSVRTYLARLDGRDARPILDQMAVLGLSRGGDLAVLTDASFVGDTAEPAHGTLARVPLTGGAARPLLEDVAGADWSPDGTRLATLQVEGGRYRLHYPVGHPIYEAEWALSHLRVSPSGEDVAFIEHPYPGDDRGFVVYVDRDGKKHKLTGELASAWGLAWSPKDDEIWFTASTTGLLRDLRAVKRDGTQRLLLRAPVIMTLHDVDRAGRALIAVENKIRHVRALRPGADREVELSEYEWASVADISADGRRATLVEQSDPNLPEYRVYVRDTDGAPSVFLAAGSDGTLSPDGKSVLVSQFTHPDELTLVPVGPGLPRTVAQGGLAVRANADWFPDGKRIVFAGGETGKPLRLYVRDLESGAEKAISGDNVNPVFFNAVSPDNRWVLGASSAGVTLRYPAEGGQPLPIKGLGAHDIVLGFSADSRSIYVKVGETVPCAVFKIDLENGKRTLLREIAPATLDGLNQLRYLALTPSGAGYVYDLKSSSSDLYLVNGIETAQSK